MNLSITDPCAMSCSQWCLQCQKYEETSHICTSYQLTGGSEFLTLTARSGSFRGAESDYIAAAMDCLRWWRGQDAAEVRRRHFGER